MARGNGASLRLGTTSEVITRDKCACRLCGKQGFFILRYGKPCVVENPNCVDLSKAYFYNGNDVIPFEIDHIIPVIKGGTDDKNNLALLCRKCNRSKGANIHA